MKYNYFIIFLLFLLLSILIIACKPTTKSETNKFNQNQQRIVTLINIYPKFKFYLAELSKKAERIFNESNAIADEDKKAEKMLEANKAVRNDKLFSQLEYYTGLLESVDKIKKELRVIIDQKYRTIIHDAIEYSNYKAMEAAEIIKYSRPQSYNDALLDIDNANGILLQAETILKEALDKINEDKNKPTAENAIDEPRIDDREDYGGREEKDSGGRDGSGSTTEKEDSGGRD